MLTFFICYPLICALYFFIIKAMVFFSFYFKAILTYVTYKAHFVLLVLSILFTLLYGPNI
jgi:hypothetical protein